jgi:hypothetical protein
MQIINLTQHSATPEQVAAGVASCNQGAVKALLDFQTLPSVVEQSLNSV